MTDGKIWRLYHRDLSNNSQRNNFQFNLGHLYKLAKNAINKSDAEYAAFIDNAKYFYHLFSKDSLIGEENKDTIVNASLEFSKSYALTIEDDLRERFRDAMTVVCNGFHRSMGRPKSEEKLSAIRDLSESHLFNLMFIKSCESKGIILMKGDYREKSLTRMVMNLEKFKPERGFDSHNMEILNRAFRRFGGDEGFEFDLKGTELYEHLLSLTDVIQKGSNSNFKNFKIEGFIQSVFSTIEWVMAENHPLTNKEMILVLFKIGYLEPGTGGKKPKQIPYNFITARQLGSIYEGFLDYQLKVADEDMALIKEKWQPAKITSEKIQGLNVETVRKGEIFFEQNDAKKKETGSYYTPDCVVQLIVKETVKPLLEGKESKDIIKLRICDPALGSGHFINASLNYLANEYIKVLDSEIHDDLTLTPPDIKRQILHNCIFGVDINPRAVKLTKMSLWLESAKAGKELTSLDANIRCADSLTDEDTWKKHWGFLSRGIDAVVGNPPYLGEKGHKELFQKTASSWLGRFYLGKMDYFYFFFHLGLDVLKDGGRLGFITTNYFTTAMGARKLRHDFSDRSNIELLMNLNELKVFGEAAGQHNMITILTKTEDGGDTKIINSNESGKCTLKALTDIYDGSSKNTSYSHISKSQLYDGDEKYLRIGSAANGNSKANAGAIESALEKIKKSEFLLGNIFEINTGIQTGADKVSPKHLEKYKMKDAKKDDGIFVIDKRELKALSLPKSEEQKIIKPFFKNSDISKFRVSDKTSEFIIYLDKRLFAYNELSPSLKGHIKKFISVIEGSVCSPPYLHRPRKNEIFSGEKIICPQRSKLNTFGYNDTNWYASCDVYFITRSEKSKLDLKYALGVLNSKLYFSWLYLMGKRKGEALELYQTPLSEVPIKAVDSKMEAQVKKEVEKLIHGDDDRAWERLNNFIYETYGLTKAEIFAVEALYSEKSQGRSVADADDGRDVA